MNIIATFKLYYYIINNKLSNNSKIYLLLFLVFAIYLISSLNWYDQSWQFDWGKHKIYFYTFLENNHVSPYIEKAPWWHNVYGPWLYFFYFIVFLPFYYLADSLSGSSIYFQDFEHAIEYSIRLGNILLYAFYLFGLIKLSKQFGLNKHLEKFFVILSFFNPLIFQYSLYAIPENLVLAFFPWLFLIFIDLSNILEQKIKFDSKTLLKIILYLLIISFVATQKASALLLICFLFLFLILKIKFHINSIINLIFLLLILYISINLISYISKIFNGYWWWQHPIVVHWANNPPPMKGFFTNFDIIGIWSDPLRSSQKNSMLGILFVDLFGDYWTYWLNKKELVEVSKINQIFIARTGLILSFFFTLFLFFSLIYNFILYTKSKINFSKFSFSILWILTFLICVVMVHAGFDIRKGSPINLMYCYFLISSAIYSIILSYDNQKNIFIKKIFNIFFYIIILGSTFIAFVTPIKIYLIN